MAAAAAMAAAALARARAPAAARLATRRPASVIALTTPVFRRGIVSYPGYPTRPNPVNTVIKFVPHQEAWVVERFGKFSRILTPGLNVLMPFIDQVKYVHSLKEIALNIPSQSAVTNDNVTLNLDGVLFLRVVDPYMASYGVESPGFAVAQLAQTTMRSEIGKLMLDQTFKERDKLNQAIVQSMREATASWGIECLRYEIRDILLPDDIVRAMQMQASAERRKRAQILDSEGARQAEVNIAEGRRQAAVLASEAAMLEKVNIAKGEAEAILKKADATADSIRRVATALEEAKRSGDAVALTVADKYIEAFSKLAKEANTLILPAGVNDPANMVAQAMAVYNSITNRNKPGAPSPSPPPGINQAALETAAYTPDPPSWARESAGHSGARHPDV